MTDWGSGYVVDTAYVHDFCRVQVPAMLSFAALAKNVAAPGGRGEALTYCDLGCGQGLTANIVAAANPRASVFAADFNPTHIAGARSLARAAGLENIEFREADFAELSNDASLPDFDIIALHGVYSWIGAEHRQAIVALIRRRLKPGGLLYISYDAMPGWAGMAPLRQLMVSCRRHGRSRRRNRPWSRRWRWPTGSRAPARISFACIRTLRSSWTGCGSFRRPTWRMNC